MKSFGLILFFCLSTRMLYPRVLEVGEMCPLKSIKKALQGVENGDTVRVHKGVYKEGNLLILHSICLLGVDLPVLDGQGLYEILSIKAGDVKVDGFVVAHSGFGTLEDPGGIKVYNAERVIISNNVLQDNFFGIYLQYCKNCEISGNKITASGTEEQSIGNGIHCWKSEELKIINNQISGHRDGIYFEFVTHSVIWRNQSFDNIRYGLHFMFSNDDAYITNVFKNNGAGVAVMFTSRVSMINNVFENNMGDASYGLLLKEISDAYIDGNQILENTSGVLMDGTNRIQMLRNRFVSNGKALRVQASCMDNTIKQNEFFGNSFDVCTNGTLLLNTFDGNYWDKYEGYDLNKDGIGDVPHHPLSVFAVISEKNPNAMLLFRSFIMELLDRSERLMPSLTPDGFRDNQPLMKRFLS